MADSINLEKLALAVLGASGEFGSASVTFDELGSIFQSIGEMTNSDVVRNLASVGAFLAGVRRDDYDKLEAKYGVIEEALTTHICECHAADVKSDSQQVRTDKHSSQDQV